MIAPNNGNGPLQGNGPSVMASSTGQGAFNHSVECRHPLPMGATPYDVTDAATLDRIRTMEGYDSRRRYYTDGDVDDLFDGEAGYFVDSRDDEARDYPEDVS